jgi:hypothetical protein
MAVICPEIKPKAKACVTMLWNILKKVSSPISVLKVEKVAWDGYERNLRIRR